MKSNALSPNALNDGAPIEDGPMTQKIALTLAFVSYVNGDLRCQYAQQCEQGNTKVAEHYIVKLDPTVSPEALVSECARMFQNAGWPHTYATANLLVIARTPHRFRPGRGGSVPESVRSAGTPRFTRSYHVDHTDMIVRTGAHNQG